MTTDAPIRRHRLERRGLAAFAAGIGFGVLLLLVRATWDPLHDLDVTLAARLDSYSAAHRTLTSFWKVVSALGTPLTWEVLAVLAGVVLAVRGFRRTGIFVPLAVLGATLLSTIVKSLVGRARPRVPIELVPRPNGSSFPSGHATTSFAAAAAVLVVVALLWQRTPCARTAATAALLVAVLIAFSRLALGVHYLSDVLGGWLLALVWVLAVARILRVSSEGSTTR